MPTSCTNAGRALAPVLPLLSLAAFLPLVAATHPTVYLTPADVQQARRNIARHPWAKTTAENIRKEADTWLARSDAWFRQAVPPAGAAFAYGSTGCPICNAGWGTWGKARASFDDPGHVVCTNGHRLPDRAHPDPGTGFRDASGRIHYFVGSYHAWVIETLTFRALGSLAYAYTLTGDERYAAKAAVLFDALAAVYPHDDKGSWDYPSDPPSGRFNRPWYQVARVLVHYVDFYDQLYPSRALDAPSISASASPLSRRRNIEENLLKNGAEYCYQQSQKGSLNNGEADYIRGSLAVGALLDIPRYIRWAVDGPYGIYSLLENNIDRDGGYFETSSLYANHTRELYFSFSEPLLNAAGLNLYTHPKLRRFFAFHNLAQSAAGHIPRYGDSSPDISHISSPARPFDRDDYDALEHLYARTDESDLAGAIRWLAGNRDLRSLPDPDPSATGGVFQQDRWLLFHAKDLPDVRATLSPEFERRVTRSDLLGQKGIAILRSGQGGDAQAALLRYGPSLNHGHFDDLNLNYFALGYEVTYDLGYGNAATHTQVGWAKQTASHNLVTVDATSQLQTGATGGSLHLFADLPELKLAEASAENSYAAQHVSLYRRTVALIGSGAEQYLLDLFRVTGGRQHDYGFHALAGQPTLTGVALGPEQPGSLAGRDIAWADRQLNDGYLSGVPQTPYWNPPPGNGYGFLTRPRTGSTSAEWAADWTLPGGAHLRLLMPATPGMEVLTALAPGITTAEPKAGYVFARRRGSDLRSEFVAAIEPYTSAPRIQSIERLPVPGIVLRVRHRNGAVDYVYSQPGEFAWARVRNGKTVAQSLAGLNHLPAVLERQLPSPLRAPSGPASWKGEISAVDAQHNLVTTAATLPAEEKLAGQVILFRNPRYSRNSAYRIERSDAHHLWLAQVVTLGRGQVAKVIDAQTLSSVIPHEYARSVTRQGDTLFFQGKRIRTSSGASAIITGIEAGKELLLRVTSTNGFRPGDLFFYDDLQPGDTFEIPALYAQTR